jgi:hypothetical protein
MKVAAYFVLSLVIMVWAAWVGTGLYDYFMAPEQVSQNISTPLVPETIEEEVSDILEETEEEFPEVVELTEEDEEEEKIVADESVSAFLEFMERKEKAEKALEEKTLEDEKLNDEESEENLNEGEDVIPRSLEEFPEVAAATEEPSGSSLVLDFPSAGSAPELVEKAVEVASETPSPEFAFGDFTGDWSNNDVDASGGLVDLILEPHPDNPELVNIVIKADGGRFVPTINLSGEMTVAGDQATETSEKPLAGDVVSTLNEDGSFVFDLNVPRFPFSVVFRGQLSEDGKMIEGQAFVYVDGRQAPTSAAECPGEPICHKVSYSLDRK